MLEGSEVKSLRTGKANIAESYASVEDGELWLINCYIPAYHRARALGPEERRRRMESSSLESFSPFPTKASGSGLGLALAQRIAIAHDGALFVESPEKGGARFVFAMPAS